MSSAPLPSGLIELKSYSEEDIEIEALRLQNSIKQMSLWDLETCRTIAPLTLEINELKREKDVFLIAHSYQTPDIVYGVADSVSDSYSLSKAARDAPPARQTGCSPISRAAQAYHEPGIPMSEGLDPTDSFRRAICTQPRHDRGNP